MQGSVQLMVVALTVYQINSGISYSFRMALQFLTDNCNDTAAKINNSDIQKKTWSVLFFLFFPSTNNDMQSSQTIVFGFWPECKGSMLSQCNRNHSKLRYKHNTGSQYIKGITSITGSENKIFSNLIRRLIMSTHIISEKVFL